MAIDIDKMRGEIEQKTNGQPGDEYDNYLSEAIEVAKKLPYKEKLEYAKANPKHLLDALPEMDEKSKMSDLLTEMVFLLL